MSSPRNLLIILIPIAQTILLSCGVVFENAYLYFAITAFIVSDVFLYFLFPSSISRIAAAMLSAPPILLFISTAAALIFVDNLFATVAVIVSNAIVSGIYLYALPSRLAVAHDDDKSPIPLFIGAFGILIVTLAFMLTLLLFASLYFLDIPLWSSIIPYLVILLSVVSIYLRERAISNVTIIMLVAVTAICLAELIYSLTWLPLSYMPLTALATIAFIILLDALLDSRMKYTLLVSGIVLVLILITSIWV